MTLEEKRLSKACRIAVKLFREILCYTQGVSVICEESVSELLKQFEEAYPECKEEFPKGL